MIFISYSHTDKKLLNEFRVHLNPLFGKQNLTLWTDERIEPGQKWDGEIINALETCKIGLMLISPDFLNSTYITEKEIPVLLERAENRKITLTSIYLRESNVHGVEYKVEIDGEERAIKLTDYQGLNTPDSPIAKYSKSRRDKAFSDAAQKLKDIWDRLDPQESTLRTGTSPSSQSAKNQLTVILNRNHRYIYQKFYDGKGYTKEFEAIWNDRMRKTMDCIRDANYPSLPENVGDTLYDILFGGLEEQACRELLAKVWDAENADSNPSRYPLRLKIYSEDPELSRLPWHKCTWMGQKLVDHGWTYESIPFSPLADYPRPNLNVKTPLPISLILPDSGILAAKAPSHYENLVDCLNRIWSHTSFNKPPRHSRWQTFCADDSGRPAEFVYFYGSAEKSNGQWFLDFPDRKINLNEFRTALATHPITKFLFLNLCCEDSTTIHESLRECSKSFPVMIVQTFPPDQHLAAERAMIDWMHAVLEQSIDPVRAINESGIDRMTVWANYERWEATLAVETKPIRDDLAKLLLDRHRQRETISKTSLDALHNPKMRIIATVACGESSDWLDLFHQQIWTTLRTDLKSYAVVHQTVLRFPSNVNGLEDIQEGLHRALTESTHQKLSSLCENQLSKARRDSKLLWILHWEPQGTSIGREFGQNRFLLWEQFCRERLAVGCPERMRILCLLPLESNEPDKVRTLVDKRKRDFENRAYRFFELDPLSRVGEDDLGAFLQGEDIQCPDDLLNSLPNLIFRQTNGRFDESVKLLEDGLTHGWRFLHGRLAESEPEPPENKDGELSI